MNPTGDENISPRADRLAALGESEGALREETPRDLHELLAYFRFLQETVLIALENSGEPFHIASDKNNPILIAYVTTTRSFSIAKASMDLALSGHALEAMALSRLLAEIAQSTQYLVRHPQFIDRFISGSFKLDQVLKAAKKEKPAGTANPFGHLRGIQSEFAHASPNLLAIALSIQGPSLQSPILVQNPHIIGQAAFGIVGMLLTQYMVFRLTLLDTLAPLEQLAERGKFLYDRKHARVVISNETMSDEELDAIRHALTAISHK